MKLTLYKVLVAAFTAVLLVNSTGRVEAVPTPTPTPEPTLRPLVDYLALSSGLMDVEEELREVIGQLGNQRRTIDALQIEPAANWTYLPPVQRALTMVQG